MKKLLMTLAVVCLASPAYATGGHAPAPAPAPAPGPVGGPGPAGPAGAGVDPHQGIPKGQSAYRPVPKIPVTTILKYLFK